MQVRQLPTWGQQLFFMHRGMDVLTGDWRLLSQKIHWFIGFSSSVSSQFAVSAAVPLTPRLERPMLSVATRSHIGAGGYFIWNWQFSRPPRDCGQRCYTGVDKSAADWQATSLVCTAVHDDGIGCIEFLVAVWRLWACSGLARLVIRRCLRFVLRKWCLRTSLQLENFGSKGHLHEQAAHEKKTAFFVCSGCYL
ncbi:hypothetical protein Efla_006985 [Eimeria flavescens]